MSKQHKAAIDELERLLFPHQESEEEQESFTPQGRKRLGAWLDRFALALVERDHLLTLLAQAKERGEYFGNRRQYWERHARIQSKVSRW